MAVGCLAGIMGCGKKTPLDTPASEAPASKVNEGGAGAAAGGSTSQTATPAHD
jgi:hypothetical protein